MPLALSWQHTGSLRACLVAWGRVLGPSRSPCPLSCWLLFLGLGWKTGSKHTSPLCGKLDGVVAPILAPQKDRAEWNLVPVLGPPLL